MVNHSQEYAPPDFSQLFQFALKWTPRALAAGVASYYSLGVAYEAGFMATIDRLAIRILLPSMGYVGIGVFMPTFQWYSAWGVRVVTGIVAGFLYDSVERIVRAAFVLSFIAKQDESDR